MTEDGEGMMPETMLPQAALQSEDRALSARDCLLAGAGVRIPRGDTLPPRFAGRRRPRWLAALIRLFA
jgi:hypothetical protein